MRGTSASEGFPIYGNKRELVKPKAEWISLVMACLTSKFTGNRDAWGCLSEDNLLFRINSLSYIKIPDWVIEHLVREGAIWLKKDGMGKGYYECAAPVKVRKRLAFDEEEKADEIFDEIVEPAKQVQAVNRRDSIMALLRKPTGVEEAPKPRRISF